MYTEDKCEQVMLVCGGDWVDVCVLGVYMQLETVTTVLLNAGFKDLHLLEVLTGAAAGQLLCSALVFDGLCAINTFKLGALLAHSQENQEIWKFVLDQP